MANRILSPRTAAVMVAIALIVLIASLIDLRCIPVRTGDATVVVVCRASRLEARP